MSIIKVISGGQTGVDVAALRAAKACAIPTGGWMPRGWRTLDGPRPEYASLFGMRESATPGYRERTWTNVSEARATLRLARNFESPGERCTRNAIRHHGRVFLDVVMTPLGGAWATSRAPGDVAQWIRSLGGPVTLNVAGNSEQTAPGIGAAAEDFLRRMFALGGWSV